MSRIWEYWKWYHFSRSPFWILLDCTHLQPPWEVREKPTVVTQKGRDGGMSKQTLFLSFILLPWKARAHSGGLYLAARLPDTGAVHPLLLWNYLLWKFQKLCSPPWRWLSIVISILNEAIAALCFCGTDERSGFPPLLIRHLLLVPRHYSHPLSHILFCIINTNCTSFPSFPCSFALWPYLAVGTFGVVFEF